MIVSPFISESEAEQLKNKLKKHFVFKTDHSVDETVTLAQILDFVVKEIGVLKSVNNISMNCCVKTNNITVLFAMLNHFGFMKHADIEALLSEIHQFFKEGSKLH